MQAENIISLITILSDKLYKSVEGQIYDILDKIILIGPELLNTEPLNKIFFENECNFVILIANALVIFYATYYALNRIISMYNGSSVESVHKFIIKLVLIIILVNSSYYICEEILKFNEILNNVIDEALEEILDKKVNFKNLKEEVVALDQYVKTDALSLEGIIKSLLSIFSISLLITFSIRYVTIVLLIILFPFAIICFTSNVTRGITKSFGKLFFVNIIMQLFIKLIIAIPMLYSDKNSIMYKVILLGSLYLVYRISTFIKELLSQICIPDIKDR